jgi:hypothetical protein
MQKGDHRQQKGVLTSGLFCDIARALHKAMAIESVDLANFYDAVAHPIASIALQSFKVHKVIMAMMLYVLKIISKNSVLSEQNLVWWYGFGPFHARGGINCSRAVFSFIVAGWWSHSLWHRNQYISPHQAAQNQETLLFH